MVRYTPPGAGLLIGLVALQQHQGVEFDTAVLVANDAISEYLRKHGVQAVALDDVVSLMKRVSPNP